MAYRRGQPPLPCKEKKKKKKKRGENSFPHFKHREKKKGKRGNDIPSQMEGGWGFLRIHRTIEEGSPVQEREKFFARALERPQWRLAKKKKRDAFPLGETGDFLP